MVRRWRGETDAQAADPWPTGAWDLPDELSMLRDTARRCMNERVRPVEERQPQDCYALPARALDALRSQARSLGLGCMASPAEYGGGSLGLLGK